MSQHFSVILAVFCLYLAYSVQGISLNLTEDTHDVYQCPDPTSIADYPLCSETIEESGHLLQVLTKTIKCPDSGVNKNKIGCIMVTNLDDNDNGGYSTIQSGGLEQYYVDIYLKSQRSKGLNFRIEVYAEEDATTTTATTTA